MTWEQQVWAAHLWGGECSTISHASAGALYGLDHCDRTSVHVTVPGGANHRAAGGLVVGCILVMGVCCGYFTRLVVTNFRLVVVQGYGISDVSRYGATVLR